MFILIPEIVDQDHTLHPNAQKLCGYVIGLSNSQIGCIASNRYFATRLGVSLPTVKRYLKDLKDKKYIRIDTISRDKRLPIRVIVPTENILVSMESSKKEITKRLNKPKNKVLPNDIESDWFDEYMKNM